MERYAVTITERRDGRGWRLNTTPGAQGIGRARTYRAAAAALRAVRRWSRTLGRSNAVSITWCPTTAIGRSVVRVLVADQ